MTPRFRRYLYLVTPADSTDPPPGGPRRIIACTAMEAWKAVVPSRKMSKGDSVYHIPLHEGEEDL